MLRLRAIAFVIAVLGLSLNAAAADIDWPHFRFDDRHTGVNRFETVLTKQNIKFAGLAWQAQLGDLVHFSSPAVVGGVVYIGTLDGRLWAYPANGCGQAFCSTPLWTSTHLSQIIDSPTVANGIVYVGSQTNDDDNDGKLNAFAAAGCGAPVCAPLWQGVAGSESILSSSPTVWKETVFVGGFDGKLYAFNAAGCGKKLCKPLWTGATQGSIESTPTVFRGVVFIGSDDGKLYAFKAKGCGTARCKPLWTGKIGGAAFESSPAIANGIVYIASQHSLSAFAASGCGTTTCAPLWGAIESTDFFYGSPAIANGRVYIPLESGIAVYPANGCGSPLCSKLWSLFGSGAQAAIVSSPTIANGVIYAGRNTAEVLAWSAGPCGQASCGEIWKGLTEDQIVSSSPSVVNGKIYIGSADNHFPGDITGRLYVYALPSRWTSTTAGGWRRLSSRREQACPALARRAGSS
jgi:outer membrane protein assembly factor BamB